MSLDLRRRDELSPEEVAGLEAALAGFYRNPPPEYYQIADASTGRYTPEERPFHCDLVEHVSPGMSVLELGCGTAHLCVHVESRGGTYTGVDYSDELIAQNRRRFPHARFFNVGSVPDEKFDLVASLYAIEHVVDPPAYLERLWNHCRPGGLTGIICPEFLKDGGLPPSVYFGRTPRRFREKMRRFALLDAFCHWYELSISGPRWSHRLRESEPGSFWINLRPRVLHGAAYSIDADAVHLAGLRELLWYFRGKGAQIVRCSDELRSVPAEVRRFNCYVLARKRESLPCA
jgi:ubiquinone/menaquinone biosynthesis C-methylase UbiE